jgi:hypothetical protein
MGQAHRGGNSVEWLICCDTKVPLVEHGTTPAVRMKHFVAASNDHLWACPTGIMTGQLLETRPRRHHLSIVPAAFAAGTIER